MKSQKGITLISLTIYIITMTIAVAMVALISNYFYTNTRSLASSINPLTEYTKFSSFFTDEVNHSNIKILECADHYVVFDNGIQYTFIKENKGIYRQEVKIAQEIEDCKFERKIKNGKDVIQVTIQIKKDKPKMVEYTLKN